MSLLSDPLSFISSTSQQHGGVVGMLLGGERIVLISDAGAARQVSMCAPSQPATPVLPMLPKDEDSSGLSGYFP